MTDWVCARCRAQVAPGAPRCPECPSTEFITEADDMLKIARDGSVSDSADVAAKPFFEQLTDVREAVAEADTEVAEAESAPEAAAVDVQAPDAAPEPDPVPSPAVPSGGPRRTPPKESGA